MRDLSSGLDRRWARVHAVVPARTKEDLYFLRQAYGHVARLLERHL